MIEGKLDPSLNYVVVEDLISTGGSCLAAIRAIKEAGGRVADTVAVFTYGFADAVTAFEKEDTTFATLTNLDAMLRKAVEFEYIQAPEMEIINDWRKSPEHWASALS